MQTNEIIELGAAEQLIEFCDVQTLEVSGELPVKCFGYGEVEDKTD